jgi:hypothetical protein
LSLRSPRRIFVRKKRVSAAALVMRSCAILAFGLTATVVAERWSAVGRTSETDLPAVSEGAPLRARDPVMRLAAALPRNTATGEQGRDATRPTAAGSP